MMMTRIYELDVVLPDCPRQRPLRAQPRLGLATEGFLQRLPNILYLRVVPQ